MSDAQLELGRQAWQRLQAQQRTAWADWLEVGKALKIGKDAALLAANAKSPYGRKYVRMFGAWLRETGFDKVLTSHRYRLLMCVENIVEIEAWRAGLDETTRNRFNHPDAVWFAWRRAVHKEPLNYTRPYRPANPGTRRSSTHTAYQKPSQDMVRILATALRKRWTNDTFLLASAVLQDMREHREEFIEFLTADPPPPKNSPRRITAPAALELSA